MFKVFQHVLPNARAWRLTIDKKLRQLFAGLGDASGEIRTFFDLVLDDLYPQTTRALSEWNTQFALPETGLTEQQQRDRLDAAWKATGGQDPEYIQATLQANGFDVYLHEWWEPGTESPVGVQGCATPRNPFLYLRSSDDPRTQLSACGYPSTSCGNGPALCGNSVEMAGYPLVNKVERSTKTYTAGCGKLGTICGSTTEVCGSFSGFGLNVIEYVLPTDPAKWPYFLYIGGETFPDIASVPSKRKNEFEALCLRLSPAQNWLGILVQYT